MVVVHANGVCVGEHAPNLMLSHTGVRRGQMSNDAIGQLHVPDRVHVSTDSRVWTAKTQTLVTPHCWK